MLEVTYADLPSLVGSDLGYSRWFLIDQQRVDRFADATDDHQWIHVDRDRARDAIGGTIAHGFLTLSLVPRLMEELLRVRDSSRTLNCGTNRVRFTQPVPTGSNIRMHQLVRSVDPRAGGMQVISDCTVEIQGSDRPACIVESVMLILP